MSKVNAADALKALNIAGSLFLAARENWNEAKALAAKAGVTKGDLDAADARYARVFEDPLAPAAPGSVPAPGAPAPGTNPPPRPFAVETLLTVEPDRSLLQPNENLWRKGDEALWIVRQKGVGIGQLPAPWFLVQ